MLSLTNEPASFTSTILSSKSKEGKGRGEKRREGEERKKIQEIEAEVERPKQTSGSDNL